MSNLNFKDSLEIALTKTKQYIDDNLSKKADTSYVDNEIANIVAGPQIVMLTQEEYDALDTIDPNTLYIIN